MTNIELFELLSETTDRNLSGAEKLQSAPMIHRCSKRMILLAAAVVAALFLVGCTVAYVLHMRDLTIGQREIDRDIFDAYHREVIGSETVPQQVLVFSGLQGSPSFQAAQEWFSFRQNYDQDGSIRKAAFANGDPEQLYPDTYWAYYTYSQEMVDELHRLAEKYHLQLLGAPMEFRSTSGLARAVGIDHVLLPDCSASAYLDGGTCYPGGNFVLDVDITLPQEPEMWERTVGATLYYARKDCLSTQFQYLDLTKQWKEWNYLTASGKTVLILRAPEGSAYFFCDNGDATLAFSFTAGYNPMTDDPDFQPEWMTDRQVEQIADTIDFNIRPNLPDAAAASVSGHTPGWEIDVKSVLFDGAYGKIILHLTAPEGTALTGGDIWNVYPDNWIGELLHSDAGEAQVYSSTAYSEDDGDGLAHTVDLVYEFGVLNIDDPVFASDAEWTINFEDLTAQRAAGQRDIEEILAQGVWELPFRFSECDYRKAEYLTEPITIAANGRRVVLHSFELRQMCALFTFAPDGDYLALQNTEVQMQDGSVILLSLGDTTGNQGKILATEPIDLSEVSGIRFPDGTLIIPK